MGNFGRDNRSRGSSSSFRGRDSGRGGFHGGGRSFDRGDDSRPMMHEATCDECGSKCEVPFRPTSGKPVYCSNCFKGKDGGSRDSGDRYERRRPERNNFTEDRQMYSATCSDCGKECQVPFQPSSDKPIYCNDCFKKDGNKATKKTDSYKEDFAVLNNKLDHVLKVLSQFIIPKNIVEGKKEEKKEEPKTVNLKNVKAPIVKNVIKKEVKPVVKKLVAKVKKPIAKKKKS
ncbi:hypothetical protein A2335_03280 [Candidatus Peregrinibacteria bacterium RIFOXYB2_FULL_32_7]|nr:MAG: hypothetical protein A2335_03280 [Candidatus Peregrinibacteria bacterium RIFOXYB2_FULL_32_7]